MKIDQEKANTLPKYVDKASSTGFQKLYDQYFWIYLLKYTKGA